MSAHSLRRLIFSLAAIAALALLPQNHAAGASSSGGYSRPTSAGSRTPSFSAPRSSSSSGGYSRPSFGGSAYRPSSSSVTDRAMADQASREALDAYRSSSRRDASARRPTLETSDSWNGERRRSGYADAPLRTTSYFSPGSRRGTFVRAGQEPDDGHPMLTMIVILILGIAIYWSWRNMSGDIAKKKNSPLGAVSPRRGYRPKWFRVGMVFPLDPTPFILAADATHIRAPESPSSGGSTSVERIGTVTSEDEQVTWYRLYLPGAECFFQVHLNADGHPDECRYFSLLDEVQPASAEEWAVWLDDGDGLIGWPQFQTKDGKLYTRVWAAGDSRVAPRRQSETITTLNAEDAINQHQSMLYAAATGLAAPAPPTEFIWVSVVEGAGGAAVKIYAGMDVSVSLLNLS